MDNNELNNNNKIRKKFSFDEVKYQFLAAFCGNFFFFFLIIILENINRILNLFRHSIVITNVRPNNA